MIETLIVAVAVLLACANGANDVSKGIATLVGSGLANYRAAILWGALWTGMGGAAAVVLARAMLATFGEGILAAQTAPSLAAAAAALAGAAGWLLIATRSGLPVSTTHALVGAVVGSGVVAYGIAGVAWPALIAKVFLPLVLSPLLALLITGAALQLGAAARRAEVGSPTARRPSRRFTADRIHWLSSGTVSFARGLNDCPKIVALAIGALALGGTGAALSLTWLFGLVTFGMAAGSVVAGMKVTRVLAEDVTEMDHAEGLVANAVTAALVTTGAVYGLPMSTTHVSSGGIVGIGLQRGSLRVRTVRDFALAWVVTLPASACLAAVLYALSRA